MAGTSGTLSRRIPQVEHSQSFPRLGRNMPAREGKKNGKAEAPPVLRFVVALFRIFGNATFRRSENRPSGPVVVALFRIKGKENYRGLRLETLFHRATV
jgi:hypothetical protein